MTMRPVNGFLTILAGLALATAAEAQSPVYSGPIIDMHLHAMGANAQGPAPQTICAPARTLPVWDNREPYFKTFAAIGELCEIALTSPMTDQALMDQSIAILKERNVFAVTTGSREMVDNWRAAAPDRIIPGLSFANRPGAPSPETIAQWHQSGKIAVLGEVVNQYIGIEPDASEFDPYLAMAAARELPVGIHIGSGPPGVIYLGSDKYRARMHSPLSLEEPLVKYPKLRVYVMHAGWPMLDDTLALLFAHPQVYVELGVIDYVLPRKEFHRYLQRLVEAGFGKRIMFGSDQMVWPEAIGHAINAIQQAEFLTTQQKGDILYRNAARFLRLPENEIRRHHQALN